MVKFKTYIFVITVSFYCLGCNTENKKLVEECTSSKIDLLLRDVFKKKRLFNFLVSMAGVDSSARYHYVSSKNFTIPPKEYYVHAIALGYPEKSDSIKLKIVDKLEGKYDANLIGINLKETNIDTTKVTLSVFYGSSDNIALNETTFQYFFKLDSCKWVVKDSTFWEY